MGGGVTACAGEVEVSTTLVQYEDEGQPPILMEVPISNGGPVATVSIDPKGLNRGCSKVVVETVKSIPMDAGGCVTATTTEASAGGHYELMSHGMDGMKKIDFAMFWTKTLYLLLKSLSTQPSHFIDQLHLIISYQKILN